MSQTQQRCCSEAAAAGQRWKRNWCLVSVPAWALLVLLMLSPFGSCHAESQTFRVAPGGIELEERQGISSMPGDVSEPDENAEGEEERLQEFVIAPLPSRIPLLGWTLALPALWLYEPSFSHPDDSVWVTGAAAFYAESESAGGGVFHKMSLGGDQWRMAAAAFSAELRYDYFGIGGTLNQAIPLRQDMDFAVAEGLYRFLPGLYLGLQVIGSQTRTGIDIPPDLLPPGLTPPDLSLDIDLVTIGPRLVYDTRNNPFYPRQGWLVEGTFSIARTGLGSDVDFERHEWAFNRYASLTDRGTLALRVATQYVGGNAPFFLVPAFGAGPDLRGYQTGTYRDRFLFAAQAEWRQRFSDRWGAVAFAGIGTVAPEFARWGKSLPSAGVGIRWVAAPKSDLSVRVDVAWGRGENEFYVSIGEAF